MSETLLLDPDGNPAGSLDTLSAHTRALRVVTTRARPSVVGILCNEVYAHGPGSEEFDSITDNTHIGQLLFSAVGP